MRLSPVLLVLAMANSLVPSLARAECNFDRPTASCKGSVTLLSSGGSKPSFNAEIEISSSAGACSKVEYFVNSTPYTSIIRSSGMEHESLFGTSPIRRNDIKVSKCTAYENAESSYKSNKPRMSMEECISSFKSALKAGKNNGMGLVQWDDAYCD